MNQDHQYVCLSPRNPLRCLLTVVVLLGMLASGSSAQSTWELTPYDVQVWYTLAPVAELRGDVGKMLEIDLKRSAAGLIGPAWNLEVSPMPASLASSVRGSLKQITPADFVAASEDDPDRFDKVLLLAVDVSDNGYRIEAIEFDGRMRRVGTVVSRLVRQKTVLSDGCFTALTAAFSPIVRLGKTNEKQIALEIRAGALVDHLDHPLKVQKGTILEARIRRNDRFGNPRDGGITTVPWTFLIVGDEVDGMLQAEVHSGFRNPLSGRSSSRTERVGMVVRAENTSTTLVLRGRDEPHPPLVGYEVRAKQLDGSDSTLAGYTDRRGQLTLPVEGERVQLSLYYVKSGGRVLARLPIVAGHQQEVVAEAVSDDLRLEAEGFIVGFEQQMVDLVAKRKILAARIRKAIQDKRLEDAARLLEVVRELPTKSALNAKLTTRLEKLSTDDGSKTRAQIDKLFANMRTLLKEHIDSRLVETLIVEVSKARGA